LVGGKVWRGQSGIGAGTVGGVASPVGEQVACPLRGELGTLKASVSPEAEEEGNCWDQEADLAFCACCQR